MTVSLIDCSRCLQNGHFAPSCPNFDYHGDRIPLCSRCRKDDHYAFHCYALFDADGVRIQDSKNDTDSESEDMEMDNQSEYLGTDEGYSSYQDAESDYVPSPEPSTVGDDYPNYASYPTYPSPVASPPASDVDELEDDFSYDSGESSVFQSVGQLRQVRQRLFSFTHLIDEESALCVPYQPMESLHRQNAVRRRIFPFTQLIDLNVNLPGTAGNPIVID